MTSKMADVQATKPDGSYPGTARLAVTLAGVSGYVDAVGVTALAGLFVSFMSGNTTSMGLSVGQGLWAKAGHSFLPIVLYVLGALLGSLLLKSSPRVLPLIYSLIALLLTLFMWLTLAAPQRTWWQEDLAILLLVVPMGSLNATLRHVGPTSVGLGYVTGTLASLGETLALAILGPRSSDRTRAIWVHIVVWLGFFGGAALGSLATHRFPSWAVAVPIVVLLVVAALTAQNASPRPADL